MPKPGLAAIDKKTRLATLWPILVGTVLVVGFFAAHQVWSTGFFTSQFGLLGTALFYSSLALGLTYPL